MKHIRSILFVISIILIISGVILLISNNGLTDKETKIVPCYDRYKHLIQDLNCEDYIITPSNKGIIVFSVLGIGLFILYCLLFFKPRTEYDIMEIKK